MRPVTLNKQAGKLLGNSKPSKTVMKIASKECSYCTGKSAMQLIKEGLNKKYMTSRDSYNVKVINDIIYNETSHVVSIFKDFLIYDDISEFLRRIYKIQEAKQRLPKVFDFYSKYSKVFPNYVVLPESKNMFKNIEKKQKLIDEKQRLGNEQKQKMQANNDSDEDNEIFTTLFLNELNKPGSTYDINQSQQATESQLFSYIKNSRVKGPDHVVEKSFQALLEKVLLKESMSFADPSQVKNEHPSKENQNKIHQVKALVAQKNTAFCKIQIDDKSRASCIVTTKNNEHINAVISKEIKKQSEKAIHTKSTVPQCCRLQDPIKITSDHVNPVRATIGVVPKPFSPSRVDNMFTKNAHNFGNHIKSPTKAVPITARGDSKEAKLEQSRNSKCQPKENDHYLTNNIVSDPSTRTHSSLKTPKPMHKFTDVDIHKIMSNVNVNTDKQRGTPVSVQIKKANTAATNARNVYKENNVENIKTETNLQQSRNSKAQTQMSTHNRVSYPKNDDKFKKSATKEKDLKLDLDYLYKNDRHKNDQKPLTQRPLPSKTPDPMRHSKIEPSKSKCSKPIQHPQTAKSNNDNNRMLFSKSVSNNDKLQFRIDQKCSARASVKPSFNAQTPGAIHSQLFNHGSIKH